MKAGPRKGQIRGRPRERPSSDRRAARATAASPGRTSSIVPCPLAGCVAAEDPPGTGSTRAASSSPTLRSGLLTARFPTHPYAARELRAEGMGAAGDLDHQWPAERLPAPDEQAIAGLDLALGQEAQHRCIAV